MSAPDWTHNENQLFIVLHLRRAHLRMFSSNIVDHDLLFEDANMCVFFVIYYEVYVVNCNVELLLCIIPGNSVWLVET